MPKSAREMVEAANAEVESLSAEEARQLAGDPDVVFVDVREGEELERTGKIAGAVHVPRGFLEFRADPQSPTHVAALDSEKQVVVYCGSGSRSALAAKTLQEMGFKNVAHVVGGFGALKTAGAPVVR